jgi:hypothetical protein
MGMIELTEKERDQMAHAIGHHSAKGCSVHGGRNYYATSTDDSLWCSLVERGLAVRHRAAVLPVGEVSFHVTPEGFAAVEADPRSQRKGKPYTVRFKGSPHGVTVYAETRGKAQYAAVRVVLDAFNMTAREAFRKIESCRKGAWS